MNSKNIIASVVILALIILAAGFAYFFINYRTEIMQKQQNQNQGQEKQEITVEDKKISEKEKPLSVEATYPYIAGLDDFNKLAYEKVQKELADFKKNALENDEAVKKIDPESYAKYPRQYDFIMTYEKGEADNNIVSIIYSVSKFEGGAHGANYFVPINYSPKENKEIKLADLFPNQPDYLQKISEFCIKELNRQMVTRLGDAGGAWVNEGAGPNEENFANFLIRSDSIVFYFPQYQVAAYAAGDFKVTMPRQ